LVGPEASWLFYHISGFLKDTFRDAFFSNRKYGNSQLGKNLFLTPPVTFFIVLTSFISGSFLLPLKAG
jgi:hypothetical protein